MYMHVYGLYIIVYFVHSCLWCILTLMYHVQIEGALWAVIPLRDITQIDVIDDNPNLPRAMHVTTSSSVSNHFGIAASSLCSSPPVV